VMINDSKGGRTEYMLWFTGIGFVNCAVILRQPAIATRYGYLCVEMTLRRTKHAGRLASFGIWSLESKYSTITVVYF
jgi:hypothetical protein